MDQDHDGKGRFAKRQETWFKPDGRIKWLDLDALSEEGALRSILEDRAR